jgi:glutathionyl-hydroquinone reductase
MQKTAVTETDKTGAFARTDSIHRNYVGDEAFPPELKRYLLICAYACPWAHRCLIVRSLYGLENCIPIAVVHPTWEKTGDDGHSGWVFKSPNDPPVVHPSTMTTIPCDENCHPPPCEYLWKSVRSIYEASTGGNCGKDVKFTVPILWDMKNDTIVNNESSEIIRMFSNPQLLGQFATKNQHLNLRPKKHIHTIDTINAWIYEQVNNGVYKCGFSKTQQAYDVAAKELEDGLNKVERLLETSRFLCTNDSITEADVRLFPTLIRHDEVYCVYFKTNHVPIINNMQQFPNINRYMKDMMCINEIRSTVKMKHIKYHYYTSHPTLNPYGIIPKGNNVIKSLL